MQPSNTIMNPPFAICIGRQLGSGGRQIGHILAEQLGIAYYDKEILAIAAEESGLGRGVFERNDERKGFLHTFLGAVQPFFGGGDFYANQLSEENLFTLQSGVIKKVASERSGIFIGRVADYILREHPHMVSVFISASTDDRARRIMETEKIDRKTALRRIEDGDTQRASYYNFYSAGTWGSADNYDLCINSSVLGIDETAQFIRNFINKKLHIELPQEATSPAPEVF